jgi:hypothetical protein
MLLLIFTTSGGTPPNRSRMTRRDYGTHMKTDWIRSGDRPSCSSACSPPFRGLLIAHDLDADMVMGSHLSPVLNTLCSRCSEAAIIPLNYVRSYWAVLTESWMSGPVQWIIVQAVPYTGDRHGYFASSGITTCGRYSAKIRSRHPTNFMLYINI